MPGEPRNKMIYQRLHSTTAYNWEEDKNKYKDIKDDGTMTFFWKAHTLTVLLIFSCILVYVAVYEEQSSDHDYNVKRGVIAMALAFLLLGVTQTPDGVFRRPHPAFWRLILCLSYLYELALVYLLFQTANDARLMMRHIDKNLGKPLPEKNYGGDCLIYDPSNEDPWHNFKDKMDVFVVSHFFGWWMKTLIIRDWWLCMVTSLMFEVMEYSLEHQLPNFAECWWDHWIMDAIVCNGLGIYLGMKTLKYLSMKPYHWRGMWNIPSYSGKMKRAALQFTPYSWTDFNWKPTSSLKRWFATLAIIFGIQVVELNTFYLKFVLWIPPEHYSNIIRLVFILFMGAASIRELFQYLDDPEPNKFGRQSWMMVAIIITEVIVTVKFDYETITKPLPKPIAYIWILGFLGLVGYTVWKFYIKRDVKNDVALKPKHRGSGETIDENDELLQKYNLRSTNNNNNGVHQRSKTKNGSAGF